jgi:hypothetical protein
MKKKCILTLFISFSILFSFSLSAQQSPDNFFKKKIGADRTLIPYSKIIKYFDYIARESNRIKVGNEGMSTENRPLYLAFISSEKNISNLQELIEINNKLANPDLLSNDEAADLISRGKVFVLVTCGIHATEIASTQLSMLLAHKLATSNDQKTKNMLNKVVLMLMPSINPDGNMMVTDWYYKYLNTKHEGCMMPYLYHKYAGHDTNRDHFMLNLNESKILCRVLHQKYFPQIFLDMHQMGSTGPRMFVPPFKDPMNSNLDPILLKETDLVGVSMALKLQQSGKSGVASGYAFDAYWPGGTKNTSWFKNVAGILTELASVDIASPVFIEENELRVRSKGLPEYKAQVNFPNPWRGGWWRFQDLIDYEMIALDALLETSAFYSKTFLANFYQVGLRAVNRGKNSPYGYHIPQDQWDVSAAMRFLKKFKLNGVRIYKLEDEQIYNNKILRKGDYIIPLAQPYGNFVKVMMEIQHYPEIKHMTGGPIMEPYDVSGWTMPILMGVQFKTLNQPIDNLKLTLLKKIKHLEMIKKSQGNYYTFSGRLNTSFKLLNRLLQKQIPVFRTSTQTDSLNPGDFLIKKSDIKRYFLTKLLKNTDITIRVVQLNKTSFLKPVKPKRIGIFKPYIPSMDEGWTRWLMDDFEFNYTTLHNQDLKNKNFSSRFDVLIIADISRNIIVEGKTGGWYKAYLDKMPAQYKGGIGKEGILNIKKFLKKGGNLILFDSAYELGQKDLSLPIRNALKNIPRNKFYCPGTILKIKLNPDDPVTYGIKQNSILFFSRCAAFKTSKPLSSHIDRRVVAGFPDTGDHLVSGYIKGPELLNRTVTTVRFNYYKGNVLVLGGRIQNRGQTFATFKFLFNSIYL